ncbi:Ionotropic receptor 93a [Eumeta japonica]|uniref:Ionotropic receptor 93a n=1 Tax=Eumeta variegata TaxID=151549 RepID=A0A4C1V7I3_EUMVA|nr:Ionotropic receptor 93a [Eumeta japonica]
MIDFSRRKAQSWADKSRDENGRADDVLFCRFDSLRAHRGFSFFDDDECFVSASQGPLTTAVNKRDYHVCDRLFNASSDVRTVVLDRQFLGEKYQEVLVDLKDYIKELTRVELKHGGVVVHYYSWSTISLKKGFMAVLSIASCEETWSLFSRTEEEELLLIALTEADCPRLPLDSAITVTYMEPGQELSQLLLDLRTTKAIKWKSAVILHDDTLSK